MSTPVFKPDTNSTSLDFKTTRKLQSHFQKCEGMTLVSTVLKHTESVHSSFSIATCCRLDDLGFKPRWGQDFLNPSRPAHPASCTKGTGSLSQGYSGWCVVLNLLEPRSSNGTATPPLSFCACLAHNRTASLILPESIHVSALSQAT